VILRDASELGLGLQGPSILERHVAVEKELAVMTVCAADGEIRAYPVSEMIFDPRSNALDLLLAPARLSDELAWQARDLAVQTTRALGGVGIFGVEMFLATDGTLLVNEVAPRPHNSAPAAMINLVGEPNATGRPCIQGFAEALALPGVSLHIYGKHEVRPFRKMGHAVVVDSDAERALTTARHLREILKIHGENQ